MAIKSGFSKIYQTWNEIVTENETIWFISPALYWFHSHLEYPKNFHLEQVSQCTNPESTGNILRENDFKHFKSSIRSSSGSQTQQIPIQTLSWHHGPHLSHKKLDKLFPHKSISMFQLLNFLYAYEYMHDKS